MERRYGRVILWLCLAASIGLTGCDIVGGFLNEAPTARIVVTPTGTVSAGAQVTLNGAESSDPDGDQLDYEWELIAPQGSTAAFTNSYQVTVTFTADVAGSYTVTLTVSDGDKQDTESLTITAVSGGGTSNNAPSAPSVPIPSNGAVNVQTATLNRLRWTASTDADGDAVTYSVHFGANVVPTTPNATGLTATEWLLPSLMPGTTYRWKVVATDGQVTAEGGPWSFTTAATQANEAPSVSGPWPANYQTDIALDPVLSWSVEDPENDTVYSTLHFGTNPNPLVNGPTDVGTGTSYGVSGLQSYTWYYWQIVVRDSAGNTRQGPVWAFETQAGEGDPTLSLSQYAVSLALGLQATITASATSDGVSPEGLYAVVSGDPSIATVAWSGTNITITAMSEGQTDVTVTSASGLTQTVHVTVGQPTIIEVD